MKRLALLILFASSSPSWAQTLKLPAEIRGKPSSFVVVSAETDCDSVAWTPLGDGLEVLPEPLKDPKKQVFMSSKPGRYAVLAVGAKGNVPLLARTVIVIEGDAPPEPKPEPKPNPKPEPAPAPPSTLFAIIVEETADAVAQRGAILADAALSARFKEKGHRWRVVDKDVQGPDGQTPADVKGYLDRAKGKGYPQLFLVNPQGKILHEGNLPPTAAELLELVKKVGG